MNQAIAIHFNDIGRQFPNGTQALREVNLQIIQGETLVLIGESGSGKTTLLRMCNQLDHPTSGEIYLYDQPLNQEDPIRVRRNMGYVQQDGGLLPHWTVERNIQLVPTLLEWDKERISERVKELLKLVGLDIVHYRHRYPMQLSGGQRQRVAFARALAADPDIILLDEPFGALDALTRREFQNQFLDLKHQLGKTMILVTHDIDEALRLGDRIGIMKAGQILQVGNHYEIFNNPSDPYVTKLLDHRTRPDSQP